MSIFDQKQLISSIHPFDVLKEREIDKLITQMDIGYYPKDTALITPTIHSEHLYIVIKGCVHEFLDDELHGVYVQMDSFDADSLIYGTTASKYVVQEDLICYELPKNTFLDLMQDFEEFKSFYLQDFITKHQRMKHRESQSDMSSFMVAKVDEIFLHTPCIVNPDVSIYDALHQADKELSKTIIVDTEDGYGIVTDSNLKEKVLLNNTSVQNNISTIATFPLLSIEKNDFLFNALLMFTKYGVKRLAVTEDSKIVGILEQLDLLSHFANHSHLIAIEIEKANSLEVLLHIEDKFKNVVKSLYSKGVKIRYISKLITELNYKIYQKVFTMCVPKEDRNGCTLIVMGSEGRGEQVYRSDQDNALIVENNQDVEKYQEYMSKFSDSLEMLGFPPCPGKVMVNNPYWCKDIKDYKHDIDHWMYSFDEETFQKISIFLDAEYVVGNRELYDDLTSHLRTKFEGRDDLLAHIAKIALSFETPLSIFSGFVVSKSDHKAELDLKKGGIFAMVHGIRTLALEKRIRCTNTIERIKELNNLHVIDKKFATELIESFDTLLAIRLKAVLTHDNIESANFINPKKLDKVERDLLKDSFKIVNKFKKFLSFHFHLNMVT
ncbi:MAG: putative nucleotidyltransferase substrate binding domain-containing protein [Campylobacterota bacterium]|nr:putative nucleotidyltransferase substrate binding domain-containing protein [Campylobacterota bacterium]